MASDGGAMAGKTCVVTGATSGIGEVTARELAAKGARVLLVGRSAARCEATAGRIRGRVPGADVEFLVADLSSQAEVRRVAAEILGKTPRLDVLVNNAGALFTKRAESVDGIEMTLALNHLGYFVLTSLLLDALRAGAPSRVVSVSSDAHKMVGGIDFDDLQGRRRYSGLRAYGQSKLANILFTTELARRLAGSGVAANALHPGVVATNFGANNGAASRVLRRVFDLVSIGVERGAQTSIFLATSPEVEGVTGRYFAKSREARPTAAALDESAARRLWEVSEGLTGGASAGR